MPPYPEQIDLPFNYSTIRGDFHLRPPSTRQVVGGGSWIIIQGDALVLTQENDGVSLPAGEPPPGSTTRASRSASVPGGGAPYGSLRSTQPYRCLPPSARTRSPSPTTVWTWRRSPWEAWVNRSCTGSSRAATVPAAEPPRHQSPEPGANAVTPALQSTSPTSIPAPSFWSGGATRSS